MNEDLKIIKKMYGEKMMHLCRELFSTLLETDGLLSKLILENFAPSKFLCDDIVEMEQVSNFKNYIYSLTDIDKEDKIVINKTPKELLEEVGYDLYECKSEEDIQSFRKYYSKKEELCTFTQGGRLNNCHVFFAVKKNVDEIKRENFEKPERQDEYGTSVISIQFSRGDINTLSIKNRYNHTVNNPDATFSNNLENIKEGLTESFEKTYNLNINQNKSKQFELKNYVKANDGKYYKYNHEINNRYYCPNNIIIDNSEVKKYDKERYIILDYFILDLQNKTIELYDSEIKDCFIDGISNIEKININKIDDTENKIIEIVTKDENKIIVEIDKTNQIVKYKNNELTEVSDNFLYLTINLNNLELPNLKQVGEGFLYANKKVNKIIFPKLEKVGDYFFQYNNIISEIYLPLLTHVGYAFLSSNQKLKSVSLPNLTYASDYFFSGGYNIECLDLPKLKQVGDYFLLLNRHLKSLSLPSLEKIGDGFLYYNEDLNDLNLPNLKSAGEDFLYNNKELINLSIPNLVEIGRYFLNSNALLKTLNLPMLRKVGIGVLANNVCLKKLWVPKLDKKYKKNLPVNLRILYNNMYESTIKTVKKSNQYVSKLIKKILRLFDTEKNSNNTNEHTK